MTKLFSVIPYLLIILILSCSFATKRIYPIRSEINRFSNVALQVSSEEILVKYEVDANPSDLTRFAFVVSLPVGILVGTSEYFSRVEADEKLARQARETAAKSHCEKLLGDIFIEQVNTEKAFKSINYSNILSKTELREGGFNSLIHLKIEKLYLNRRAGDLFKLYSSISGNMINLAKNEIIWKSQETIISDGAYSLEEYKADSGKILKDTLKKVFKKAALRFSLDISQ
jgi:hypothetical protein